MKKQTWMDDAIPFLVAALVLVLTCAVVGILAYADGRDSAFSQHFSQRNQPSHTCIGDAVASAAFGCVDQNVVPAESQDLALQDLRAQQIVASWTRYSVAAGAFGTLITAGGAILVFVQVRHSRRALEDSASNARAMLDQTRIMEDGQRAFISIHPSSLKLRVQGNTIDVEYTVEFRNVGSTIASAVHPMAAVRPSGLDPQSDIAFWRKNWTEVEDEKQIDHWLVPGETFANISGPTFHLNEMPWSEEEPKRFRLILHTGVFYDIVGGQRSERKLAFRAFTLGLQLPDVDRRHVICESDVASNGEFGLVAIPIGQNTST